MLQFGRAFPRILQTVWEADPVQGPVRVSKLDITDVYNRGTVKQAQVGVFAYVIPSSPGEEGIFICIKLVLPMRWIDFPKLFCAFLKTLTDVANALVNSELPVLSYVTISEIPPNRSVPPHTPERLTHIYCYMGDVISVLQGGPYRQHRVFDGTVRALKWLFPSLPGELKDSVSVKNLVAGEGDCTCVKEVLRWILDTEAGKVTLPERKLKELLTLVGIPATQRRMGRKDLERLVGKLRSMHLSVPGAVAHLFHIQRALNQGGVDRAWLLPDFRW